MKVKCIVCTEEFDYGEMEFCCSGKDCTCGGLPIDPPICSPGCWNTAFNYNNDTLRRE